jgi:hypothetical protein
LNVAVEGDPERLVELALKLELLKILDALSRSQNLKRNKDCLKIMEMQLTDLDCNHANSCNYIQGPPKDAIVG